MKFGVVCKYPLLLPVIDDINIIYEVTHFLHFKKFLLSKDFLKSSEGGWELL